jgi:hypothetical protein
MDQTNEFSWKTFFSHKRVWIWIGAASLVIVLALGVTAEVMIRHAGPILKRRIIGTLSAKFHSRVELQNLDVSLLRGLEVSGAGLRIYPQSENVAGGASYPLISVKQFSFHSGILGLFFVPTHVAAVHIDGLRIDIPPHQEQQQAPERPEKKHHDRIKIVVDDITCDNSQLIIETAKPNKDPKVFELEHIALHDVGPEKPWQYRATLVNPVPRGEIHATGMFGPWQADDPGESSVSGHYTFQHADLNTIKGIGGMLSSVGDFKGRLDKIIVDGTTDTPDFSLDTAHHPMPLHTRFHAIVDGVNGDTSLDPVSAKLGSSSFTTRGAVINIKGRGHIIELDVDVPRAQIQDFLDLAVETKPAVMTGSIHTKAKLRIRPGKEDIVQKLSLQGNFSLTGIHFTNPKVQDKVDMLSLRAQGEPKKAKPGARDVNSHMDGVFSLDKGVIHVPRIKYVLPGAQVNMHGVYSLDGQQFEFKGKVLTRASLSQMVDSPWKSALLKLVSPFFSKKGGGAEIPVKVSGTKSDPKFGLDVLGGH